MCVYCILFIGEINENYFTVITYVIALHTTMLLIIIYYYISKLFNITKSILTNSKIKL